MKILFQIIFILFSFSCLSQKKAKPDIIKQISTADTVVFIVKTSGCFDAGTTTYKLAKQKNKDRVVVYGRGKGIETKKIPAKDYETFVNNFKVSEKKFSTMDTGLCTLITEFELSAKKQSSKFTNRTCEAEFNPEEVLKQLMK